MEIYILLFSLDIIGHFKTQTGNDLTMKLQKFILVLLLFHLRWYGA